MWNDDIPFDRSINKVPSALNELEHEYLKLSVEYKYIFLMFFFKVEIVEM